MKNFLLILLLASFGMCAQTHPVNFQAEVQHPVSDSLILIKGVILRHLKSNNAVYKDTISVKQPGLCFMFDGKNSVFLYFENGFDIKVSYDASDFLGTLSYKGKGSAENNLIKNMFIDTEAFKKEVFYGVTDLEATERKIGQSRSALESKVASNRFSDDFKSIMANEITRIYGLLASSAQEQVRKQNLLGKPLPYFRFKNYDGSTTNSLNFKGHYMYIDVWATWCGACLQEMPALKAIEEKYRDKNIVFVGISADKPEMEEKWRNVVKERKLGGIQLLVDNGLFSPFIYDCGINAYPRYMIVDP